MGVCDQFVSAYWRYHARKARATGRYTRETLRLYWRVWQISQSADDLLAFLLFRRDLGLDLTWQWSRLLRDHFDGLPAARKILAYSLLFEFHRVCPDKDCLPDSSPEKIQLPAVVHCLSEKYALNDMQRALQTVYDDQADWQQAFYLKLSEWVRGNGVCVVGNAANMTRSGLGGLIDRHACVVRFNVFSGEGVRTEDIGEDIDVWCVTPSFKAQQKPSVSWSVLLGPELQFRTINWSGFVPLLAHGGRILTVPKPVWSELVLELGSPPSAGIAFLAYVNYLLGSFEGVSVAGFGGLSEAGSNVNQAYHHTTPRHKASPRHNWMGERALIQRWLTQGLVSLHDR